jgi:hypothetical protein
MVKEGEYSRHIMQSSMKMENIIPVETIPRMGWGGIKENHGGFLFNYDIL